MPPDRHYRSVRSARVLSLRADTVSPFQIVRVIRHPTGIERPAERLQVYVPAQTLTSMGFQSEV